VAAATVRSTRDTVYPTMYEGRYTTISSTMYVGYPRCSSNTTKHKEMRGDTMVRGSEYI